MTPLLRLVRADVQLAVWLLLITATGATAVLGLEQAAGGAEVVGIVLLTIAFVKMRLVGLHFMELRAAPIGLRAVFECWVLVTFTVLVTLYLVV